MAGPAPPVTRQAQRIAVTNNAAVVLSFKVHFKDASGKNGVSASSNNLMAFQTETIDMAETAGIQPGLKMKPRVSVMAGSERDGPEVEYAENGLTATYTVAGTVANYKVELL